MRRCPAVLLALGALLLPCCRDADAGGAAERIVLLGGNIFGDGDRCARVLNEMVAVSGVVGETRFEVIAVPGATPVQLVDSLREMGDARAVIVIVGDRSLLSGIDTNAGFPTSKVLSSRAVDEDALDMALDQLRLLARSRGMHSILATHPLGRQGRIEVPELVAVAERVREHGATLDLAAAFAAREQELLFTNDIDVLDAYGHDVLAGTLLLALLGDEPLIPAEQPGETAARAELAALLSWARGEDALFRRAARSILSEPASDALQGTRHAAIATLLQGLTPQTRQRWTEIDDTTMAGDVPGLAVGRILATGEPAPGEIGHPIEQGPLSVLDAYRERPTGDPLAAADAWIATAPHHASAWLTLEFVARLSGKRRGVPRLALHHLQAYRSIVSPERWRQLSSSWPDGVGALPAIMILEAVHGSQLTAGPALHAARRASRLGLRSRALALLDQATEHLVVPRNWISERERIVALADP